MSVFAVQQESSGSRIGHVNPASDWLTMVRGTGSSGSGYGDMGGMTVYGHDGPYRIACDGDVRSCE